MEDKTSILDKICRSRDSKRNKRKSSELVLNYLKDMTSELSETATASVTHNPMPLCLVDNDGLIVWFNEKFGALFQEAEEMESKITEITSIRLTDIFRESGEDQEESESSWDTVLRQSVGGKIFKIMLTSPARKKSGSSDDQESDKKSLVMLHWIDITPHENLKLLYRNERTAIALINIDNYDELINSIPEENKASVLAAIETKIRQWGMRSNGALVAYSPSQYIMVLSNDSLEELERSKFSILDEIRDIETYTDFPASLTIGIGCEGKNPAVTQEYAKTALDLALGRGGDQVVVKRIVKLEFYGGKLQTVEKRNKGKSRILAHALRQLIDQSDKVIVMGHKIPDMDALGAAIGVFRLAAIRDKDVHIVIDDTTAVDILYREAVKTGIYSFISKEVAVDITNKDTLVVVVDTGKPSLVECPALLTKAERIVVIDHHRRGEEVITSPTLSYIEAYASSASELVAELLEYSTDKKAVTKLESEALLAGISVDTKNFSVKTGVRTYQAASWLRRQGADPSNVRRFFQTNMDLFKSKASIISHARTISEGVAMSYCEGRRKNLTVLISMAADELLNIKGIKASFVLGEDEDGVIRISARSLGEVNVQRIMEKLGGGGHFTTAGGQMNTTLDEAVDRVEDAVQAELGKTISK